MVDHLLVEQKDGLGRVPRAAALGVVASPGSTPVQSLLEALPLAIAIYDRDDRLVATNERFAARLGVPETLLAPGTSRDAIAQGCSLSRVPPSPARAFDRVSVAAIARQVSADEVVADAMGGLHARRRLPLADGGSADIYEDIGDRVATERDRRASEARMRQTGREAERQAREAEVKHDRLIEALDGVPEALVFLDAEDRYVFWNRRYAELYIRPEDGSIAGTRFVDLLRAGLRRGEYPDADGREEQWLRSRLDRHAMPCNTHEQHTSDGRWIRVDERRTADGGSIGVRTDITDLKHREASFRLLFDANPVPMLLFDRRSLRVIAVNDEAVAAYGYGRAQIRSMTVAEIWPGEDSSLFEALVDCPEGQGEAARDWRHRKADGTMALVRIYARSLTYEGVDAALCSIVDVTKIRAVEQELSGTRMLLDSVVESIPFAVFAKEGEGEGRYVIYNHAAEQLAMRSRAMVIGRTDFEIFDPAVADKYRRQDLEVMASGVGQIVEEDDLWSGSIKRIITKKLPIRDAGGVQTRYLLGIQEDVTERRAIEQRMAHMALHDSLTELPNRVLFRERLDSALREADEQGGSLAIHWIDLDRFKEVNDSLGHQAGDALLTKVAERLRASVRQADDVSRLGGDEFAVLQTGIEGIDGVRRFAQRLVAVLSAPYVVLGQRVEIGASIGVASSNGRNDADELLRNADLALYRAKAGGRSTFCLFEESLDVTFMAERALAHDLRHAMERGEFELYFQPVVTIASRAICSCEALLRWNHPVQGVLTPPAFLPLVEEIGLMPRLGEWVLQQACLEAARWPAHQRVAVNLSSTAFETGDLVQSVTAALEATQLSADRLELEITETVLLIANERNLAVLHQLRAKGISIALDDFGTGYSSLSYLRSFPFDRIKIDRSFVCDMDKSPGCLAIIRAVVGLGCSLGMRTTAEGVETPDQFERLREEGCDEAQGYMFSRPVPAIAVRQLLGLDGQAPPA